MKRIIWLALADEPGHPDLKGCRGQAAGRGGDCPEATGNDRSRRSLGLEPLDLGKDDVRAFVANDAAQWQAVAKAVDVPIGG